MDDFSGESSGVWELEVQDDAEFEAAVIDQKREEEDNVRTADNPDSIENDSVRMVQIELNIYSHELSSLLLSSHHHQEQP